MRKKTQLLKISKSSTKRKIHSDVGLPKKIRTISNKQFNVTPKETGKRIIKPKICTQKEIIKIRASLIS